MNQHNIHSERYTVTALRVAILAMACHGLLWTIGLLQLHAGTGAVAYMRLVLQAPAWGIAFVAYRLVFDGLKDTLRRAAAGQSVHGLSPSLDEGYVQLTGIAAVLYVVAVATGTLWLASIAASITAYVATMAFRRVQR